MRSSSVQMKDGRKLYGAIWTWMPQEGYFTLSGEDEDTNRGEPVYLRDVERMVTAREWLNGTTDGQPNIGDRDELARARHDGWDGT